MNKMKNKKYQHTVGTVPKSNRKITETVAKSVCGGNMVKKFNLTSFILKR
jgi:hypothetical protein